MSKLKYEISFVFFINHTEDYKESIKTKDALLDELDNIREVTSYDVEQDDEDWCIEVIAEIECEPKRNMDEVLHHKLGVLLTNTNYAPWDYHYMKGLDNDFYWCP